MFSKLGQYEAKRKALENERHNDYLKLIGKVRDTFDLSIFMSGTLQAPIHRVHIYCQNDAKVPKTGNEDEGGLFSKLGQYENKRKVLDEERHNEYNKRLNDVSTF